MLIQTSTLAAVSIAYPEFSVFVKACRNRFRNKDWGDLCEEDKEMNKDFDAEPKSCRLFAKYDIPAEFLVWTNGDTAIYIIKEFSNEVVDYVTTILFPSEY